MVTRSDSIMDINTTGKTPEMVNNDKNIISIIHDIRNPLAAIRLAHQQLREEIQSSNGDGNNSIELLDAIITRNIDRIEQQLQLLIASEEKKNNKFSRFDIARIINSALHKAKDRIFLSGLTVQENYMSGHFIQGNLEDLTNAFLNIILNAVEAARQGEGQLWIAVYEIDKRIKVVFKDNGQGIAPELLHRIYEPGFTNKPGGMGMGLQMVRNVLDEHAAEISIMSEPGVSTTVVIIFRD